MTVACATLHLRTVSGPERIARDVEPGSAVRLGRSPESEVCLLHQNVSRRHASISEHTGSWFVTDLDSRHGTSVNGVPLEPNRPARLEHDDRVRIGPWEFRVDLRGEVGTSVETIDDQVHPFLIQQLDYRDLGAVAQQRLDLLIDCSALLNTAESEADLLDVVLGTSIAGTGFARAAWIRPLDATEQIEVVATRSRVGDEEATRFSRSVLRQAQTGRIVRLASGEVPHSHSIAELGIHTAMCVPIRIGDAVSAYLYLDARGHEAEVRPDAAPFCQALARLCGLALSNVRRAELESRQRVLDAELTAAREAQQIILPPPRGTCGRVQYASEVRPGLFVAGDLFDIIRMDDQRTAVSIGDVTGEGIGAALLMAATQAQLHAALMHESDPATAVAMVDAYVIERSPENRFVTMWVGVIDHEARTLTWTDAGHGHWLLLPGGSWPAERATGIPLGIDAAFRYRSGCTPFLPESRILLLSDGVIEQRDAAGEQFGWSRVWSALAGSASVDEDVQRVLDAVTAFAGTDALDDDATIASVGWE